MYKYEQGICWSHCPGINLQAHCFELMPDQILSSTWWYVSLSLIFNVYFCRNVYVAFHHGDSKLFEDEARLIGDRSEDLDYPLYVDLISLLKRVWSDGHVSTQTCLDWNLKCLVVQVIAKIGNRLNIDCDLELLELAIHSESVEVQNEALMSLPIIVLYSGPRMLGVMFKKLEWVNILYHDFRLCILHFAFCWTKTVNFSLGYDYQVLLKAFPWLRKINKLKFAYTTMHFICFIVLL